MKKVLLLFFLFVPFLGFSQKKKSTVKSKPISKEETIKRKTLSWFKDFYVEMNWKDPYSFKLMNSRIRKVSLAEHLKEFEHSVEIDLISADTSREYGSYQVAKRQMKSNENALERAIKDNSESGIRLYNSLYKRDSLEAERLLKKFTDLIRFKTEINNAKDESTPEKLNAVYEYVVYIDAYGKNSYGNEVLGKYYYTIDLNGEIKGDVKKFD